MSASTLLAAILALAVGAFATTRAAADPDLFWHLASGRWMLEHGALLERDIWSHTRAGVEYSVGQWLGQILLALAHAGAGWSGIHLLRAVLVSVSVFFLTRATLRLQSNPLWAIGPILGAVLVGMTVWGERPQLFSLALFPIFLDLLLAARLEGRTRRLLFLPPLALLWANLHGAFVVGLALVAIFLVEALLVRARGLRRPLAVALGASALAALVNPAGPAALGWAAGYASAPARFIVEERPPDVFSGAGLTFAALLLATLFVALRSEPLWLRTTLGSPLLVIGLAAPFAYLGLSIQRQLFVACCVLVPIVAAGLPLVLRRPPPSAPPRIPRALASAVLAVAFVAAAGVAAGTPREPDLSDYPAGALAHLDPPPPGLLNEYDWGGFLIHSGQRVFIDGRGAALFVPEVLGEYMRAVRLSPGYEDVLASRDIRVVLLRPERALAVALLERGWPIVGEGPGWILLERPR